MSKSNPDDNEIEIITPSSNKPESQASIPIMELLKDPEAMTAVEKFVVLR